MTARYSLIEASQQHGYVVALMAPRLEKSRDGFKIVADPERGRVFQLFKQADPDTPAFEFVIPDRTTLESQQLWRDRCKMLLDKEWEKYRAKRKAMRTSASGPAITAESPSPASNLTSSSTEPPTKPESSSFSSRAEPAGLSGYGHDALTPGSFETIDSSLPTSVPL